MRQLVPDWDTAPDGEANWEKIGSKLVLEFAGCVGNGVTRVSGGALLMGAALLALMIAT